MVFSSGVGAVAGLWFLVVVAEQRRCRRPVSSGVSPEVVVDDGCDFVEFRDFWVLFKLKNKLT